VVVRDRAGIDDLCTDYYSQLYQAVEQDPSHLDAMEAILQAVEECVTPEGRVQLSSGLTTTELLAATKEMASEKSQGPDGYAIDFYMKF
jgi:hypothetical protein